MESRGEREELGPATVRGDCAGAAGMRLAWDADVFDEELISLGTAAFDRVSSVSEQKGNGATRKKVSGWGMYARASRAASWTWWFLGKLSKLSNGEERPRKQEREPEGGRGGERERAHSPSWGHQSEGRHENR